jgi:hypothetical protein
MALVGLGGSDCETIRDAWLAQPVNCLSSLAYVLAGVFVWRKGGQAVLAAALVAVGVGSFLYHGPMRPGAEVAHDGSIVALAVVIAYGLCRRWLFRPPAITLVAGLTGLVVNLLTRTGAPLCRSDSPAQGHAAWHVLTAVALAAWLGRVRPNRLVAARR